MALYILVPLAFIYIYKTRPGMRLRALGENPGRAGRDGLQGFCDAVSVRYGWYCDHSPWRYVHFPLLHPVLDR